MSPLTVSEDRISKQVIIPVTRERGTFGDVTVTYEVKVLVIIHQIILDIGYIYMKS